MYNQGQQPPALATNGERWSPWRAWIPCPNHCRRRGPERVAPAINGEPCKDADAEVPVAAAVATATTAEDGDVPPRPRTRRTLPPAMVANEEGEARDGNAVGKKAGDAARRGSEHGDAAGAQRASISVAKRSDRHGRSNLVQRGHLLAEAPRRRRACVRPKECRKRWQGGRRRCRSASCALDLGGVGGSGLRAASLRR